MKSKKQIKKVIKPNQALKLSPFDKKNFDRFSEDAEKPTPAVALTLEEDSLLRDMEIVIGEAFRSVPRSGYALSVIMEKELYRNYSPAYKTFRMYLLKRWSLNVSTAYRLIRAYKVLENLRSIKLYTDVKHVNHLQFKDTLDDLFQSVLLKLIPFPPLTQKFIYMIAYNKAFINTSTLNKHITAHSIDAAIKELAELLMNAPQFAANDKAFLKQLDEVRHELETSMFNINHSSVKTLSTFNSPRDIHYATSLNQGLELYDRDSRHKTYSMQAGEEEATRILEAETGSAAPAPAETDDIQNQTPLPQPQPSTDRPDNNLPIYETIADVEGVVELEYGAETLAPQFIIKPYDYAEDQPLPFNINNYLDSLIDADIRIKIMIRKK